MVGVHKSNIMKKLTPLTCSYGKSIAGKQLKGKAYPSRSPLSLSL